MRRASQSRHAPADLDRELAALILTGNAELLVEALRASGDGDGAGSLVALASARGLRTVVDDLLGTLVVEARTAGRTWAEIGRSLGVTRQAVIQRFGERRAHRTAAPTGEMVSRAGTRAIRLLEDFAGQRWEALRGHFDERMASACSVDLLRSVRTRTFGDGGDVVRMERPTLSLRQGYTVVDVPVVVEHRRFAGRVVFHGDGRVAGFFVRPANPPAAGSPQARRQL